MRDLVILDLEQLFIFILHKSIFIQFVHHGTKFYDKYINTENKKSIVMMIGVVFLQNIRMGSFILKSPLDIYKYMSRYFRPIYKNIQEYKGCIQGENERQQVFYIFKVHHFVMLKDHQSSDHVFMMQ